MRRTKEEAELTKSKLIDAAFQVFYECGFYNSSLDQIAKTANVTRGAVYWHYKNKKDLYAQTILYVISKMTIAKQSIISDTSVSPKEKLVNLLWLPHKMRDQFAFMHKVSIFFSQNDDEEFQAAFDALNHAKLRLYNNFLLEVKNIWLENPWTEESSLEDIAILIYSLFEGMYNANMSSDLVAKLTEDTIKFYINLIIDN